VEKKYPMMVPQVAEKLTVIDVQDSSPKSYSAFEEWVQGSGVSEAITRLNLKPLTDRAVIALKLRWKKYSDRIPPGLVGVWIGFKNHEAASFRAI
jgi:hypothetical protein